MFTSFFCTEDGWRKSALVEKQNKTFFPLLVGYVLLTNGEDNVGYKASWEWTFRCWKTSLVTMDFEIAASSGSSFQ